MTDVIFTEKKPDFLFFNYNDIEDESSDLYFMDNDRKIDSGSYSKGLLLFTLSANFFDDVKLYVDHTHNIVGIAKITKF